jgi:uncharacterized protein YicC (UPF0701 family)
VLLRRPASLEEAALEAARQCVEALKEAREREGARLVLVLQDKLKSLKTLAAQAVPLVPQAVQRQQERFVQKYQDALQAVGGAVTARGGSGACLERGGSVCFAH